MSALNTLILPLSEREVMICYPAYWAIWQVEEFIDCTDFDDTGRAWHLLCPVVPCDCKQKHAEPHCHVVCEA